MTIDELVLYKGKRSVIPFHERIQVVQACKYVDVALPQSDMDKLTAVKNIMQIYYLLVMIGITLKMVRLRKRIGRNWM